MLFEVNQKFEQSFFISEEVYQHFIALSQDKNPLHTDENFAKQKGFKGKVMHGNILNGFLSYFIGECLPTKNVIIHLQEISFKNPAYLFDQIKLDAVVSGIFESVQAVEFKFTFKNKVEQTLAKGKVQIGLLK